MTEQLDQESINYLVANGVAAIQALITKLQTENEALREEVERLRQERPSAAQALLTFPERLIRLRIEKGFTQRSLAAATGVSTPMISRYENGQCRPRLKAIFRLEKALDCPGVLQGYSHD